MYIYTAFICMALILLVNFSLFVRYRGTKSFRVCAIISGLGIIIVGMMGAIWGGEIKLLFLSLYMGLAFTVFGIHHYEHPRSFMAMCGLCFFICIVMAHKTKGLIS